MRKISYLFLILMLFILACIPKMVIISGYIKDSKDQGISEVKISFGNEGGMATTNSSGFYEKKLPKGWSGTITPSKENFNFLPSKHTYNNLAANASDQDFIGYLLSDLPVAPTNLRIKRLGKSALLHWDDNSSNEDGFIIRRTLPKDATLFVEIGRVPSDTTKFLVIPLNIKATYIFRVAAYNKFGESKHAEAISKGGGPFPIFPKPTDLEAVPRYNSILLSWKDNSNIEIGFEIQRRKNGQNSFEKLKDDLTRNSRCYLDEDKDLVPGVPFVYRVRTKYSDRVSEWSHHAEATTEDIISIAHHTNGLEVDNKGGGAEGWNYYNIFGFDQLYDGHLQIWTGGNIVYDGDDGDFVSQTSIALNPMTNEMDYEYTSASLGSLDPVIVKCNSENVEIHQFTYRKKNQNWVLIDWTVYNTGKTEKDVKLALFLDVDAGGDFSDRNFGGFDESKKLTYTCNEDANIYVGMAVVFDVAYFENYQICYFSDSRTPDNSNMTGSGETARRELFKGSEFYVGMHHGRMDDDPTDLTMTLISNLGTIAADSKKRVCYAISVEKSLANLQNAIEAAKTFVNSPTDNR